MNDFLNSKSMLMPGVAGATTTTVTASLVTLFGLPGNWTALALSMMFAMAVWGDRNVGFAMKIPLYVINSLMIFSMAFGINSAGAQAFQPPEQRECIERLLPSDSGAQQYFRTWRW